MHLVPVCLLFQCDGHLAVGYKVEQGLDQLSDVVFLKLVLVDLDQYLGVLDVMHGAVGHLGEQWHAHQYGWLVAASQELG